MSYDEHFLQQFEDRTLPFELWHHRAHVKLAYLYLTRLGPELAAEKLREGIRAYNVVNHVPNTLTSGYHETQTLLWLRIIHMTIREYGPKETADEFFDFHPQLSQVKMHRLFYSKDLFMSARARQEFVEPDLATLPKGRQTTT